MKPVKRKEDKFTKHSIIESIHKYAYIETFVLVMLFFVVDYFIKPEDICHLQSRIPYLLIILTIITLFHGFESGMFAIGMIAVVMWFFYPSFPYEQFLILLMMTLIFSQFQYYWSIRIREAELMSEYKSIKLNELSKAFYTLKISHDQLEKNYVTKPMSLRDSLISIRKLSGTQEEKYTAFLTLLEKSFSVELASIAIKKDDDNDIMEYERIATNKEIEDDEDYEDALVEEVLRMNRPAYISDGKIDESKYIAVIPVVKRDFVTALLFIRNMPFMAFNRENLISIAILFEYFYNEFAKEELLYEYGNQLEVIHDREFKFELYRLYEMYLLYKIDSTILVLEFENEILALKVYEVINNILRSLDMVTYIEQNNIFYVSVLFPFADHSTALGFLERLKKNLSILAEAKEYEYFNFSLSKIELYDQLISGRNEHY